MVELAIKRNAGKIIVYNATEGGARIHGAIELTLKKAIDQLCQKKSRISPAIIKSAPQMLTEEEKKRLRAGDFII